MNPITKSTPQALYWWQPAAWLQVTGVDAASFLQGQFTNDLKKAGAVYGLWLNVKGKVLADSFVLRGAATDEFWIGSYSSPAATIKERLESHVIADDVTVEDRTSEWTGVTLFGGSRPDRPFVFPGRRGREDATEWVFPVAEIAQVKTELAGVAELGANELARLRIEAGIAAVPMDIGPADLPNEAGLEADAISYTKGCYLGQEVMARLKSMGQVRRRLLRVRGTGEVPQNLPAALFAGPRQMGELRSAARAPEGGFIGLALISLLHVPADKTLSFAAETSAATVQLLDVP